MNLFIKFLFEITFISQKIEFGPFLTCALEQHKSVNIFCKCKKLTSPSSIKTTAFPRSEKKSLDLGVFYGARAGQFFAYPNNVDLHTGEICV